MPGDIADAAEAVNRTPLEYMLAVMNDRSADNFRRDRMAMAAAPYVHSRPNPDGKKADADADAHRTAAGQNADWGDDLAVPSGARSH